jgi:hypothetical protein
VWAWIFREVLGHGFCMRFDGKSSAGAWLFHYFEGLGGLLYEGADCQVARYGFEVLFCNPNVCELLAMAWCDADGRVPVGTIKFDIWLDNEYVVARLLLLMGRSGDAIAVGTAVAGCPPHGPGRALISASGSYLG